MINRLNILKNTALLLSILIFVSCGNLRSFQVAKTDLSIQPHHKVTILSLDCITKKCKDIENKLHQYIQQDLELFFKKHKIQLVEKNQQHDYELLIISAHEEDIHDHHPRNVYIIIRDQKKNELLQIGVAEEFSTPMTKQFIDMRSVNNEIRDHLIDYIATENVAVAD